MDSSFNPAMDLLNEVKPRKLPWLNIVLFVATCLSTLFVGGFLMADFNGISASEILARPQALLQGWSFALAIMTILFSHEMGHYLACRYYGIDASLPYFIPFPSIAGTMGAFIRIRSPFLNRGSLLVVGVAGPIAGFVVAVAAFASSIRLARFVVPGSGLTLGEPLIFKAVEYLMGMTPPQGMDSYLHPVSFAAWVGFLVTALNLLPAAQLDGGHITYALFGKYHKRISWAVVAVLLPLAIFYWFGWFLWIGILLVIKLRHPSTLHDSVPLQRHHVILGWVALLLLILCFMPAPIDASVWSLISRG
jgi:membrane-associated protease RseP (regulator of RpoE activity)